MPVAREGVEEMNANEDTGCHVPSLQDQMVPPLVLPIIPRLHKTEQNLGLLGVPPAWSASETPAGESSKDLGCSA